MSFLIVEYHNGPRPAITNYSSIRTALETRTQRFLLGSVISVRLAHPDEGSMSIIYAELALTSTFTNRLGLTKNSESCTWLGAHLCTTEAFGTSSGPVHFLLDAIACRVDLHFNQPPVLRRRIAK